MQSITLSPTHKSFDENRAPMDSSVAVEITSPVSDTSRRKSNTPGKSIDVKLRTSIARFNFVGRNKASAMDSKISSVRKCPKVEEELQRVGIKVNSDSQPNIHMTSRASGLWQEQLKSVRNVEEEVEEKISTWIIRPDSLFRNVWDFVMIVLMAYTVVYLPFKIGFGIVSSAFDSVEFTVDILFMLDILISFFLAYETNDGGVVTNHKKIIKSYLFTWFPIDLVAAFPFEILGYAQVDQYTEGIKAIKLLRMIKLLRLYRLKKWYHRLEHHPRVHRPTLKLTWFMLLLFSFSYFSGCLWHFVGELEDSEDSWINRAFDHGIKDKPISYKVLVSMYWSLTTLTTIGYGDISAQTESELLFSLFIMLCGASLFSFITASASHVLKKTDATLGRLKKDLTILSDFGKTNKLKPRLLLKAMANLRSRHRSSRRVSESVWPVVEKLNPEIQKELALFLNQDLLKCCPFLIKFRKHKHFVTELLSSARPGMAYPGEFIVNQGDHCEYFYMMRSGTVTMVFSQCRDLKLTPLTLNDVFGHEVILITGTAICNILCASETHFIRIETRTFLQILSRFPERYAEVNLLAEDRILSITQQVKKQRRIAKEKALKKEKIFHDGPMGGLQSEMRKLSKIAGSMERYAGLQMSSLNNLSCTEDKVVKEYARFNVEGGGYPGEKKTCRKEGERGDVEKLFDCMLRMEKLMSKLTKRQKAFEDALSSIKEDSLSRRISFSEDTKAYKKKTSSMSTVPKTQPEALVVDASTRMLT